MSFFNLYNFLILCVQSLLIFVSMYQYFQKFLCPTIFVLNL